MNISLLSVTSAGHDIALRLEQRMRECRIYSPEEIKSNGLSGLVSKLFYKQDALIFIMAAGIAVRSVAPLLRGKDTDPAVVVVDEKGRYSISLLSGHMGGANKLSLKVAEILGAEPVITTATDINNLPCIEDIAERFNLAIENPEVIKYVNSDILKGKILVIIDSNAHRLKEIKEFVSGSVQIRYINFPSQIKHSGTETTVLISTKKKSYHSLYPFRTLILRPREFVVGIGCDRGISREDVNRAFHCFFERLSFSPLTVRNLASIDIKSTESGLLEFAKDMGLEIDFFSKDQLIDLPLPSGHSDFVMRKVGVGGVCEPAALKSANTKKIWIKKWKKGKITMAVARVPYMSLA